MANLKTGKRRVVFVAAAGIAALALSACSRSEPNAPVAPAPAPAKPVAAAPAPAAPGPQTACPIMGGGIDRKVFADYAGKRVYFCCEGCVAEFKKAPAKYVKDMEDKGVVLDKTPADAAK